MTTEQQLQAIAEHLRKHGWTVSTLGDLDAKNGEQELYLSSLWRRWKAMHWPGRSQAPSRTPAFSTPLEAFNAIADAAGVPQLEAAQ